MTVKFQIALNPHVTDIPYGDRKRVQDASRGRPDLVDLSSGNPDAPMPPYVTERLRRALDSGLAPYTNYYGFPELRQSLARHLQAEFGLDFDPETELLITNGVQEGLYVAMRAVLQPGDQVLLPSPHYAEYYMNATACGCESVLVPLDEANGYVPDIALLARAITPRTRALIFCNPSNPLGVVWPRPILEGIAELALAHNLIVLVDEIYHDFTFVASPPSIASLPGMKERTLTFGGFSKSYMMMGLRVGWMAGPAEAMFAIKKLHYCVTLCPSYLGQIAAQAALDCPREQLEPTYAEFHARLDLLYEAVTGLPGVTCVRPAGSFFIFPNISCFGMSSMELALLLIREAGVSTLPGTEFGPLGEGHLRLSVCARREQVERGIARLQEFAIHFDRRRLSAVV